MTQRQKTLIFSTAAIVLFIAILCAVTSTIVLNGFAQVEAQDTQKNVDRAVNALNATISSMDSKAGDWANWDDAYKFVEDGNADFVNTNVTDESFVQLKIDIITFVNTAGQIVYSKSYDEDQGQAMSFPASLSSSLSAGSPMLQHPDAKTGVDGILLLPEGPLLVASRSIQNSNGDGPSHGSLIFARFLDASAIQALSETTHLTLTVERFDDPQLPADFKSALTALSKDNPRFVQPLSSTVIAGYALLGDTDNRSALVLRAEQPRTIYAQAQVSVSYLLVALAGVGLLFLLAILRSILNWTERQDTERRYRSVVEQTSEGIFLFDLKTRLVVEANAAFSSLLGYTPKEFVGRPIDDFTNEPRETRDPALPQSPADLGVQTGEQKYHRKDGSLVDVEVTCNLIEHDGRQVACVVVRDITERKRAQQRLQESEERYSLAARGVNDGLWDWNLKTNDFYYSPHWKSMLGYEADEIGTSHEEWTKRIHPDDRPRVNAEVTAHLEGTTLYLQSEFRMQHKDGSYLWMLCRGLAIRDVGGEPYRMAGSLSDITSRKRAEEQLLHDAFHDALTGLPNRALFVDRLGHAIERARRLPQHRFAVLYLDCDRFKLVNDSLGHPMGDRLLIAAAQRLQLCLRSMDTVARLGGDEFVILLEDLEDESHAVRVAERIQSDIAIPFNLDGRQIFTSVSIGIVLSETGYDRPDEILRDADIAMYRAKALGRARYELFDSALRDRTLARSELENDLHAAVERNEFELHYQPIMSLENNRLVGFEALVRWRHPRRGLLAPAEFIPIAEDSGLIIPLGNWVLNEACRQMSEWKLQYHCAADLAVSVNLSVKQFAQADLPEQVARVLRETHLDPHSLRLEITEGVIMEDKDAGTEILTRLQDLGVEVQIDDFGTGYSSLSYLQQFPISTLKIDRSFVARMNTEHNGSGNGSEIVQTIVMLARQLGLKVVAEGVETADQLSSLRALECEYVQGYFISKPLSQERVEPLITNCDKAMIPADVGRRLELAATFEKPAAIA